MPSNRARKRPTEVKRNDLISTSREGRMEGRREGGRKNRLIPKYGQRLWLGNGGYPLCSSKMGTSR
jgi:hypothetical protein